MPQGIPDGFLIDDHGRVWTSAEGAVHVHDADASHLAEIPVPGTVSNVAFDADHRMLFITGDELWGLRLG